MANRLVWPTTNGGYSTKSSVLVVQFVMVSGCGSASEDFVATGDGFLQLALTTNIRVVTKRNITDFISPTPVRQAAPIRFVPPLPQPGCPVGAIAPSAERGMHPRAGVFQSRPPGKRSSRYAPVPARSLPVPSGIRLVLSGEN